MKASVKQCCCILSSLMDETVHCMMAAVGECIRQSLVGQCHWSKLIYEELVLSKQMEDRRCAVKEQLMVWVTCFWFLLFLS